MGAGELYTNTRTNLEEDVYLIEEHVHEASKVYPTLVDGVVVTGGVGAWALGAAAEIVPASTITEKFDIHYVSVENISANGVYELVLYYGDSDVECGRVRFTKTALVEAVLDIPIMTPIIPANSKITAKVASNSGGSDTVTISVFYHTY